MKTPQQRTEAKIALNTTDRLFGGRGVSVEMGSKKHVNSLIDSDDVHDRVLFDVNLGELIGLTVEEGGVLEVKGAYGILRVDLAVEELEAMLSRMRKNKDPK